MNENYDFFEELYEEMIDEINNTPLTTSRLNDYSDIISINENIVNTIFNIRRFLEINDEIFPRTSYRDTVEVTDEPIIQTNIINSIVDFFLDNNINDK